MLYIIFDQQKTPIQGSHLTLSQPRPVTSVLPANRPVGTPINPPIPQTRQEMLYHQARVLLQQQQQRLLHQTGQQPAPQQQWRTPQQQQQQPPTSQQQQQQQQQPQQQPMVFYTCV